MTDSQCVDYLENICKMFVHGCKNCEGQALEYQQKYIQALRYAKCEKCTEVDPTIYDEEKPKQTNVDPTIHDEEKPE